MSLVWFSPKTARIRSREPLVSINSKGVSFLAGLVRTLPSEMSFPKKVRVGYDEKKNLLVFKIASEDDSEALSISAVGRHGYKHGRIVSNILGRWLVEEKGIREGRYRAEWDEKDNAIKVNLNEYRGGPSEDEDEDDEEESEDSGAQAMMEKARTRRTRKAQDTQETLIDADSSAVVA